MVRHIVMWNCKEGYSEEENRENKRLVKEKLESLVSVIPGIISLDVTVTVLDTGNRDVILNSLFENEEALNEYIVHPEHVRVGEFVRSVLTDRACIDYEDN